MRRYKLTELQIDDQILPVEALIHPRATKLKLRFSRDYKKVVLTLPHQSQQPQALKFLEKSRNWIETHYPNRETFLNLSAGSQIPYLGRQIYIYSQSHTRSSVWEEEDKITIFGPSETFEEDLIAYFKTKLRIIVKQHVKNHCKALDVNYNRLFIRNSQSNWGCCSSRKNLSFSWRLIFTPLEVIDYLAAHETAHLIEMNHSKDFWTLVGEICPDYKEHRRWLKAKGKYLL